MNKLKHLCGNISFSSSCFGKSSCCSTVEVDVDIDLNGDGKDDINLNIKDGDVNITKK